MKKLLLLITMLFTVIYGDSKWVQANGPGGAYITYLAKSASAIFAGTERHGVFRSTDNGESWSPISLNGKICAFSGFTMYAIGGGSQKIFRSTDDGISWVKICDSIRENIYVGTLKSNRNYLFALCVENGVFRSSDSGVSWIPVNNGIDSIYSISSIEVVGDIVFTGGIKYVASGLKHAVFRSLDNGSTWSPSDSGIPDQTGIYQLTVCSSSIIAISNNGLYISNDSGSSWKAFNASFLSGDTLAVNASYTDNIRIAAEDDLLLATQTEFLKGNAFLSTNKGSDWSAIGSTLPYSQIKNCMVNNNVLFIGTYSGISRSTDSGKTWVSANSGIIGTNISSFAENGKSIFTSTYQAGVFVSVDNGLNWSEFNTGLTSLDISSLAVKDSFIFACSPPYGIFRSSNRSAKWVNICSKSPFSYIKHLAVYGGKLFSSNNNGLYFSIDNGENWIAVTGAPTGLDAIKSFIVCDNTLFAGGEAGLFYYDSESNTLNKVGSKPADESITCLAGEGNLIFAGTEENGCFVSKDKGRNWQQTSLPYATRPNYTPRGYDVARVTSLYISGNVVVASLPGPDGFVPNGGCYFSADSGKSWKPIGPDTSWHSSVTDLLIREDTLLAGSFNKGVWMRTLPKVSETAIGSSKSGLNPNPQLSLQLSRRASSGLCVTYTLPQPADVSVSIHSLNGSRVASLVNKTQPAGLYNYTWSYGETSGLYIIRLKTGGQIVSKTIMFTP